MLKKLSRIFGITGGILAMLPYLLTIVCFLIEIITSSSRNHIAGDISGEGTGLAYVFLIIYIAPVLFSCSGIIASFYVRRRPAAAGAVIALSGVLNLLYMLNNYFSSPFPVLPMLSTLLKILGAVLLLTAGVLAVISRRESPEDAQSGKAGRAAAGRLPLIRTISFIIAVICSGLHMLPWAILSVFALFNNPPMFLLYSSPLLVSAMGLWGSLVLRKRPVSGAVIMFLSAALVYLIVLLYSYMAFYWWLRVPPLLLVAAVVFALIGAGRAFDNGRHRKTADPAIAEKKRLRLINISRITGVACGALHTLFWAAVGARGAILWVNAAEPYLQKILFSEFVLYSVLPLLVSAAGLWGSLLLMPRKIPQPFNDPSGRKLLPCVLLMVISGGLVSLFTLTLWCIGVAGWWVCAAPLLFAAAGVFVIIAAKVPVSKEPLVEPPGRP